MQTQNRCPYCGHINRSGVMYCDECGQPLTDQSVETLRAGNLQSEVTTPMLRIGGSGVPLADPAREYVPFVDRSRLVIHIRDADEPLIMIPGTQTTFGRQDVRNPHHIDIDLTPYNAFKMGVSRVHAMLYRGQDHLSLADAGSANGTFINGALLVPNHPIPLCDGDEVRMGNLIMHFYFNT